MRKLFLSALLLSLFVFIACGNDASNEKENEKLVQETTENMSKDQLSDQFTWDNIPDYPGATLESTEDCPAKWAECEKCEHKLFVTDDDPADVCQFYKDKMLEMGWVKIVYQFYPEGSCLGTYNSNDGNTRVFMNVAQRRSDNKTFIAITMGQSCP